MVRPEITGSLEHVPSSPPASTTPAPKAHAFRRWVSFAFGAEAGLSTGGMVRVCPAWSSVEGLSVAELMGHLLSPVFSFCTSVGASTPYVFGCFQTISSVRIRSSCGDLAYASVDHVASDHKN